MRQHNGRVQRHNFACAGASVIAHPVDVEMVIAGVGIDLEIDCLPRIHTDIGGEALNTGIATSADTPICAAGELVFASDGIGTCRSCYRNPIARYQECQTHKGFDDPIPSPWKGLSVSIIIIPTG